MSALTPQKGRGFNPPPIISLLCGSSVLLHPAARNRGATVAAVCDRRLFNPSALIERRYSRSRLKTQRLWAIRSTARLKPCLSHSAAPIADGYGSPVPAPALAYFFFSAAQSAVESARPQNGQ